MTSLAHGFAAHGDLDWGLYASYSVLVVAAGAYLAAATLRAREPRGWNHWRTVSFMIGVAIIAIALRPSVSDDFADHMLGHLLIGMFAPLALVLSAPTTLVIRSVPPRQGRMITHVLRAKPARWLANPVILLVANLGGLWLLYFTPLFALSDANPGLHDVVHVHFFIVGYLFAWMVAGPDPGPDRPSVRIRLLVLGIAIAGHAVIAQLLYAGIYVQVPAPPSELRAGGTLMYYWGDIAEILLALALLVTWKPDHRTTRSTTRSRLVRRPRVLGRVPKSSDVSKVPDRRQAMSGSPTGA
ncbi:MULTISPECIES: cytochrome c oxidase assembly protein [Actinomycetes]|uniref:cytochrome c oxidase assembly protein n=1 Tax=Actinomycetes TaxID=1760 RepID=UPI0009DDB801|nr:MULTISPECIES: cytochrome c oxidase assembly protein [Actinomycetes]